VSEDSAQRERVCVFANALVARFDVKQSCARRVEGILLLSILEPRPNTALMHNEFALENQVKMLRLLVLHNAALHGVTSHLVVELNRVPAFGHWKKGEATGKC
jgi:hypothetical protein